MMVEAWSPRYGCPQGLEGGSVGGVWASVWGVVHPQAHDQTSQDQLVRGNWAGMGGKNCFKPVFG